MNARRRSSCILPIHTGSDDDSVPLDALVVEHADRGSPGPGVVLHQGPRGLAELGRDSVAAEELPGLWKWGKRQPRIL